MSEQRIAPIRLLMAIPHLTTRHASLLVLPLVIIFALSGCDGVVSLNGPESQLGSAPDSGSITGETTPAPGGSIVHWGADLQSGWPELNTPPWDYEFTDIAVGDVHAVALTDAGEAHAWGYDGYGRLSAPNGIKISAGYAHNLALREDGTIAADGIRDELGFTGEDFGQVTDTPDDCCYIDISASFHTSTALNKQGQIVAWGDHNWIGLPPSGDGFVAIDGDYVLHENGHIEALWGSVPDYLEGDDFIKIRDGVGLREDGSIAARDAPAGSGYVDVAAGLALHHDGSLTSWGTDDSGQVSDTPAGNNFVAIASGSNGYRIAIEASKLLVAVEPLVEINLRSEAPVPVAIISDERLNAPVQVVREELTFGATGDEETLDMRRNGIPNCHEQDVSRNGLNDLVCYFNVQDTGFSSESEEGIVKGRSTHGIDIEGRTEIRVGSAGDAPIEQPGGNFR